MKKSTVVWLAAALVVSACAAPSSYVPNEQERGILSTKLVNLSSAVDVYFADLAGPPTGDDEQILLAATRHDSRLLAPEFKAYVLKVQYQAPYAVLLLCSKDGSRAIMEDAGCSARLDRNVAGDVACEFTLHVNAGCQVDGADRQ
jgi:hypothetical protein